MPVISVGNLTWGGNGKTPMVEFVAKCLADYGISPLILTRVFPSLFFVTNFIAAFDFSYGSFKGAAWQPFNLQVYVLIRSLRSV